MNLPGLIGGGALVAGAVVTLGYQWAACFRDPRFRTPNWITAPATEDEIYLPRDIPRLVNVHERATRRLRLTFSKNISARAWRVFRAGQDLGEHRQPDLIFEDNDEGRDFSGVPFRLEPVGSVSAPIVQLRIHFYPQSHYHRAGLSWPNAYILTQSNIAIGYPHRPGHTLADWVGLKSDDPILARARAAMEAEVDFAAPALVRQEAVFRFLMRRISTRTGLPDDALLNADAWTTWERVRDGHDAFCECKALIYYLFANAAGIPTRLVDLQGRIGALVLTGHYICESWIADEQAWTLVDPHNRDLAWVRDPTGRLLHTVGLKQRYDLGCHEGCTIRQYDRDTADLVTRPLSTLTESSMNWIRGPLVIGFKFGYPRNAGYSRLKTFFFRPTRLYSPLDLPRPRRGLVFTLATLVAGLLLIGLNIL